MCGAGKARRRQVDSTATRRNVVHGGLPSEWGGVQEAWQRQLHMSTLHSGVACRQRSSGVCQGGTCI